MQFWEITPGPDDRKAPAWPNLHGQPGDISSLGGF